MPAAHLFRSVREELQLVALQEILRATAAALPLREILAIVANMAIIAFDATIAWIMRAEDGQLRTVVACGVYAGDLAPVACALGTGAAGRAIAHGQPVILQPREIDPTDATIGLLARQTEPIVLLPLTSGGRILGLLGCAAPDEEVHHLTFLATLAQHACAVIDSDRLRSEARSWHQRLDAVFERMAEAVFVYDRDGTLALMNAAAATMLRDAHVQVGDTLADVVRKADLRDAQGQPFRTEEMPTGRALAGESVDNAQEILFRRGEMDRYYQASAVPLVDEGRVQGAVAVWRDVTERKLLEDERVALLKRERVAREIAERAANRTARLHAVAAALAEALTPSQVANVIIDQGMAALGADAGFVALLTHGDAEPELVDVVGYAQDVMDAWRRSPQATAAPIADLVRTKEAVWLETRESLVDRYPHLAAWLGLPSRSWAYLPLLDYGRTVGVVCLSFPTERQFSPEERAFMLALARQCAQALERARLYRELAERERRLQDLVGRLLVAQEEERRRVAYEVHDDLAAVAASAHQHLQAFARHHRPRSPRAREEFDRALALAQRTVRETRRVVANLRPTTLDDFGLAAALRLQVEELRAQGWHVTYQEALGAERLPPLMETALFRVAQEALTNARKHAQTTAVRMRVERAEREVRLLVEDEGRGFVPEAIMPGTADGERVGLPGMRERVAMLGGHCVVESQLGAGTRVSVVVPLEASEHGRDGR
ncbi:MAG TPA: GAF domain-containing protein [Chloroflexota bacterium]|nr:GAF domain-containing protein [Chloroflexota bacterium]